MYQQPADTFEIDESLQEMIHNISIRLSFRFPKGVPGSSSIIQIRCLDKILVHLNKIFTDYSRFSLHCSHMSLEQTAYNISKLKSIYRSNFIYLASTISKIAQFEAPISISNHISPTKLNIPPTFDSLS